MVLALVAQSAVCVGFAGLYAREAGHNAYHRSKAAEHEMLWRLLLVFPLGTPQDQFMRRLGLPEEAVTVRGAVAEVAVRPRLSLRLDELRDYPGFVFAFREGRLADAYPIGPDGPGWDVDVSAVLDGPR